MMMGVINFILIIISAGVLRAQLPEPCPSRQNVVLGQKAKLKCDIRDKQGLREWSVMISGRDDGEPLDSKLFQQVPDGILVEKVTEELRGTTLRLKITNPVTGAQIQLNYVNITVYGPPKIKADNSKVYVEDADTIGCVSRGTPTPRVQWIYKLSERLDQGSVPDQLGHSFLRVGNRTGPYQCQADNGYGLAIDNVNVVSKADQEEILEDIESLSVERVGETRIQFKVEPRELKQIYYAYTLYAENKMMREDHNGTAMVHDGSFVLNGFPSGAYIIFHFATVANQLVKLSSNEGLLVTLLPPKPRIAVTTVTNEFVTIEWREPWIAKSSNARGIDFYQLKYSQLTQKGDEFESPTCTVETKIPSCVGNNYKIYRRSSSGYSLIELRAHNSQGYSDWSDLLISYPSK